MAKKRFTAPCYEVIHFSNKVLTTSGDCSCYDELLGEMEVDCTGDGSGCGCRENYGTGANCVPCDKYQG